MATEAATVVVSNQPEFDPETQTFRGTRKLRPSGNSVVLTIAPNILQAMGVEAGDEVEMVANPADRELCIRPAD